MAKPYFYTFSDSEIEVDQFLDPANRFFSKQLDKQEFLLYEGGTGLSNNDRVYAKYNSFEKELFKSEYFGYQLPYIKTGTDLILPSDQITIENLTLYGSNQFLSQQDFTTYWSENYQKLIDDELYVPSNELTKGINRTEFVIKHQNLRIYIWIAALNKVIDVTTFVSRISTSKGFTVGTFSMTLNPILNIDDFIDTGLDTINYFPLNKTNEGQNVDFFETNLQYNDLVFIRYEVLALESNKPFTDKRDLEVDYTNLPGQVWDMIGLVDQVSVSNSSEAVDKIIQVSGRDLTKLLIDDASYFIPTVFLSGSDLSFIYSGNPDEEYYKRNFISGAYDYYFSYSFKSIRDVLGFVINHLSNLEIVNDDLFNSYGDRISKTYDVTGADKKYIEEKQVKGIWKIIKFWVDPVTDDRRIADDSFANPDGSLIQYIDRICQRPFVEFYGDTNGDQYDFIVRQPPLDGSSIRKIVGQGSINNSESPVNGGYINIFEKNVLDYALAFDTDYYSWYQIQAQNLFMGNDDTTSLSIIPIIFLPDFVKKFGNKRLIIPDNYFPSRSLKGDEDQRSLNIGTFVEKALNDLKYMIDVNAYLPFTRKGTITINGDRRIKVGSFVRLLSTDELFYVTNVNNSASFTQNAVDRTTVLTVERGMKVKYINGIAQPEGYPQLVKTGYKVNSLDTIAKGVNYSYFNIVDTNLIINTIIRKIGGNYTKEQKSITTSFGVNTDVFNFFVNREQFKQ